MAKNKTQDRKNSASSTVKANAETPKASTSTSNGAAAK